MRVVLLIFLLWSHVSYADDITVGSKAFTESHILAQIASLKIGTDVQKKLGLGGTGILYEALRNGSVDLYPEYTGTISEAILKVKGKHSYDQLQELLTTEGFVMSAPLGFNNTYALAVSKVYSERFNLTKLSQLRRWNSPLRSGFSHEFVGRSDCLPKLKRQFGMHVLANGKSFEHALAYQAVADGKVDLIDVYSTDAKIAKLDLVVLEDDLHAFPEYQAVYLASASFVKDHPLVWNDLNALSGTITEEAMRQMNAEVEINGRPPVGVAAKFLGLEEVKARSNMQVIYARAKEHVLLVFIAFLVATGVGIPLGVAAAKQKNLRQFILLTSGTVQTIPAMALLSFLIPLVGIGVVPSVVALGIYSLLPVVLNTYIGISSIESKYIDVSRALGLTKWQTLKLIELPLASRSIYAGIKTSVIVSIGTATLAALIGAGGFGAIIMNGLTLNDSRIVLQGAVPASLLALAAHGAFYLFEPLVIPKGLRL
jgi:osmoprotectant transport system permease protein